MILQEKYKDEISFVTRSGKSDIIVLSNINSNFTEAWHDKQKVSKTDEAECVIITAAKLIKNAIKNHTHKTDFCPTIDDIMNTDNKFVPLALQT